MEISKPELKYDNGKIVASGGASVGVDKDKDGEKSVELGVQVSMKIDLKEAIQEAWGKDPSGLIDILSKVGVKL